jgi:NAD-dependent deacetylase
MIDNKLVEQLRQSQNLVVLTGAGVSAESGIPTFRDALRGLWKNFDAEQLASEDGFLADPELVWGWYEWRRHQVAGVQPNQAHQIIAKIAKAVPKLTLITQNVDDLHERAGSGNVLHLHGSLNTPRCIACEAPYRFLSDESPNDQVPVQQRMEPPLCCSCGKWVRPGVVWFGESLPIEPWTKAIKACSEADLMLVIGTSGLVWPAADLHSKADRAGCTVVQINTTVTSFSVLAKFNLTGLAGDVLPQIYEAAFPESFTTVD